MNQLDLSRLEPDRYLELNAKLQRKKTLLRTAILRQGTVKKDKKNAFDGYTYLSEAGYKALIAPLLVEAGLELTARQTQTCDFEGTNKQPYGRTVTWEFTLTDTETGFFEVSPVDGEGIDKGDKAVYKADTGALKYYLANTFLIVAGDEPENEGFYQNRPTNQGKRQQNPQQSAQKASVEQIEALSRFYSEEQLTKIRTKYNVQTLDQLPAQVASGYIKSAMKKQGNQANPVQQNSQPNGGYA